MILEFTKQWGQWKPGEIVSESAPGVPLTDTFCRTMITDGSAKESTEGAQTRSLLLAEVKRMGEAQLAETRSMLQGKTETKGPPNGGGGVDFTQLSRTEGVEERGTDGKKTIKRTFGEYCKCIALYQSVDAPPELRSWAHKKLKDHYGAERCEYKINEEDGSIAQTVTRTMDYGIETITRTGTESLGGGPTYGFALKPEYMPSLFELPTEQSVFSTATFGLPIGNALELKWPALDQYKPPTTLNGIKQSAVFAGFQIGYVGETTARPASDAALSDINFKILDLTGFTDLSRDLIADNYIAMDAMATRVFGKAFVWMEDYMTIQGSGLGQPEGFFSSAALLTQTRGTASHIEYEDIVGMMAKLHPMCWQGSRWICSISCLPDLVAVKNHAGTLVYQPNTMIAQNMMPTVIGGSTYDSGAKIARPQGTFMGFPLFITEKVPKIGTQGDLNLVCPDQYGLARRAGLEVGLSEHFYFSTDRIAYRFKMRHDGKSLWRAPYTQVDGTTQVTPFVQLV